MKDMLRESGDIFIEPGGKRKFTEFQQDCLTVPFSKNHRNLPENQMGL